MTRNKFFKHTYRSNYRGKVSVEDALKHQQNIDGMKEDAVFYCLDHIESAMIPQSMLHKIIQKLKTKQNDSLTKAEKAYLIRQNLDALHKLVEGELTFNQYKKESLQDRVGYIEQLEKDKIRLEKIREQESIELQKQQEVLVQQRRIREQAEREQRKKLESDPKYISQQKEKVLLNKYQIYSYHIPINQRFELLKILNLLDNNQRLKEQQAVWLNSEGYAYFTDEVKMKFHRIEANFYLSQYEEKQSYWDAINASSQLRKCKESKKAEIFLEKTKITQNKNKKLLSAYFTTLGGVKRDLKKSAIAIEHGLKAHEYTSQDYRPCTLLGALYMENHEYNLGHDWYSKARERGAPENSINAELRSILLKLDTNSRNKMISNLLKREPVIYKWLEKLK